jgi:hypothetical protein
MRGALTSPRRLCVRCDLCWASRVRRRTCHLRRVRPHAVSRASPKPRMALRGEVSYSDHGGDGPFDHSQRSEAAVEDQALWLGKPCDAVSRNDRLLATLRPRIALARECRTTRAPRAKSRPAPHDSEDNARGATPPPIRDRTITLWGRCARRQSCGCSYRRPSVAGGPRTGGGSSWPPSRRYTRRLVRSMDGLTTGTVR